MLWYAFEMLFVLYQMWVSCLIREALCVCVLQSEPWSQHTALQCWTVRQKRPQTSFCSPASLFIFITKANSFIYLTMSSALSTGGDSSGFTAISMSIHMLEMSHKCWDEMKTREAQVRRRALVWVHCASTPLAPLWPSSSSTRFFHAYYKPLSVPCPRYSLKGKFLLFYFPIFFVSKLQMGTTIFETEWECFSQQQQCGLQCNLKG